MIEKCMQKFADFGKIWNMWENETGGNGLSGTEELREKREYQNEKEDSLRIRLNDKRNVVLLIRKKELHGIDAFGDTGLYTEKYTYNEKMKSGKLQITKNDRRIYTDGKEAA